MWEKRSKIWMPREDPIYLRLKQDRGYSRTIIGAICKDFSLMQFQIVDKTNIVNVKAFLEYLCSDRATRIKDPSNTVIVLDNHAAHRSKKTKKYAKEVLGLKLLFLPPAASELNPIERMWAYFKQQWRLMLSDPDQYDISIDNIDRYLTTCLNRVAGKGTNLCKGPLNEILLANAHRFKDPRLYPFPRQVPS